MKVVWKVKFTPFLLPASPTQTLWCINFHFWSSYMILYHIQFSIFHHSELSLLLNTAFLTKYFLKCILFCTYIYFTNYYILVLSHFRLPFSHNQVQKKLFTALLLFFQNAEMPPSMTSGSFINVHFVMPHETATKTLSSSQPRADPWGTPFVVPSHLDRKQSTATFWALIYTWLCSQFETESAPLLRLWRSHEFKLLLKYQKKIIFTSWFLFTSSSPLHRNCTGLTWFALDKSVFAVSY